MIYSRLLNSLGGFAVYLSSSQTWSLTQTLGVGAGGGLGKWSDRGKNREKRMNGDWPTGAYPQQLLSQDHQAPYLGAAVSPPF